MAREQGTKSSWNFLSWFYPSGPGRGFRGICGFGSAGRRTRYKKVIKCGERVCISTHLSGSRSLFFSFSANTPGEAAVEIWFTVLWNYGTCPNTRWLKLEFASRRAAGVDALDGGEIFAFARTISNVHHSDMHCRPGGDQNTELLGSDSWDLEAEHLSAGQPCCGRLWGPGDLDVLMCWASVAGSGLDQQSEHDTGIIL